MSTKFLVNIDLNNNEILKGTFQKVATDPNTNLFEGWTIYNTTADAIRYYDGAAWKTLIKGISSAGANSNALTVAESNGAVTLTLNLADASNAGLLSNTFYSLLNGATASPTVSTLVRRDTNGRFQAEAPSADKDVANKAYVDAARSGLDVKDSVKFATSTTLPAFTHTNGVLTATSNGALSIDGTTLVTGDIGTRVLVKNETSTNAPFNGIYTVTNPGAVGAPYVLTRATDADTNTEVTPGMFVFVEQGSAWADSGWVLTTDGSITLGTTALTFVQFSSAGQSIAGNGLTKTGNTLDVVGTADRISVSADAVDIASTYVGQTSITTLGTIATGTWNATDVAVVAGGTGASTAADARTNLAETSTSGRTTTTPVLARIASQGCAASVAGTSTTTITHNFGTKNVIVQVYETSNGETVVGDVARTNNDVVTVTLLGTITANDYYIVVTG